MERRSPKSSAPGNRAARPGIVEGRSGKGDAAGVIRFQSREDPDIDVVWTWFEFQLALIGESHANVLRGLRSGMTLGVHEQQFIGFTLDEIEEFFAAQRGQLELLVMFELL